MKHSDALKIAEEYLRYFRIGCGRIEIAGSIRRGKDEVKDIELVGTPDLEPLPKPRIEFGKPIPVHHKTMIDYLVAELIDAGTAQLIASGDKFKKIRLLRENIQLDLFLVTPPAQWGVQAVIRTGPADFSHWVVSSKSKLGGAMPDGYFVKHGVVWIESLVSKSDVENIKHAMVFYATGKVHLEMREEIDFLKFLNLGWLEPHEREARWAK